MFLTNSAFVINAGGLSVTFPFVSPTPLVVESGSGNNISLVKPVGTTSGDLIITFVHKIVSGDWTEASGFTEIYDNLNTEFAYKVAGGSEPATYDLVSTGGGGKVGTVLRVQRGVYGTIGAFSASGASPVAPAITMSRPGLLLAFFRRASGTSPDVDYSVPTGMTLVVENHDYAFAIFAQNVGSGDTGTRTSTASADSNHRGILLGVVPT